jgi:hypothetical protein
VSQAAAANGPRGPRVLELEKDTFRQVHPNNVHEGRLTRCAFEVKDWDNGLLSIALSTKTTAEAAHKHFTEKLGRKSCGVYAVTVGDCDRESLKVWEDPETEPPPDPAHGVIDFRDCLADKKEKKRREVLLARIADQRGPVYRP